MKATVIPLFKQFALHESLGDLDGVQGRSLAQVIRYYPHVEPIGNGRIRAQAADKRLVLALGVKCGRVYEP